MRSYLQWLQETTSIEIIYIVFLFIIAIVALSGCIHSIFNSCCKCCRREDNFRYSFIFMFVVYIWEYMTDMLFVAILCTNHWNTLDEMSNEYTILIYATLGCLSITYLVDIVCMCSHASVNKIEPTKPTTDYMQWHVVRII